MDLKTISVVGGTVLSTIGILFAGASQPQPHRTFQNPDLEQDAETRYKALVLIEVARAQEFEKKDTALFGQFTKLVADRKAEMSDYQKKNIPNEAKEYESAIKNIKVIESVNEYCNNIQYDRYHSEDVFIEAADCLSVIKTSFDFMKPSAAIADALSAQIETLNKEHGLEVKTGYMNYTL